jgi:hypothetical protein
LSVEGVEIFKPFFTQIGLWVVALVISISDCQKNGKKREGGGDYLLTVSLVFLDLCFFSLLDLKSGQPVTKKNFWFQAICN